MMFACHGQLQSCSSIVPWQAFKAKTAGIPSVRTTRLASARGRCASLPRPVCSVAVGTSLTFNVAETSISFPFHTEQAQQLSNSITELIKTFAAKQKAERPRRWNMMEFKYKNSEGNGAEGVEYLEVFCNPNAYATAFDAKVLITVRSSQGLKVTTEGRLSNLKGDVDTFLEQS